MDYEQIGFELSESVATVTLNRPERLNAYTSRMGEELRAAFGVCDERDDVRAVIGTPHPRWGEQVTAIVVRRDGAVVDGAALADFAGARLAGFKKPRRIEFVASLPRNAYNKVQTHLLKQEFGAA